MDAFDACIIDTIFKVAGNKTDMNRKMFKARDFLPELDASDELLKFLSVGEKRWSLQELLQSNAAEVSNFVMESFTIAGIDDRLESIRIDISPESIKKVMNVSGLSKREIVKSILFVLDYDKINQLGAYFKIVNQETQINVLINKFMRLDPDRFYLALHQTIKFALDK